MRKKLAILLSAAMIVSCVTGDFYRGNRTNVQAAIATAEEALQVSDLLDMSELAGWAAVKGEGLESTTGGGNAEPVVVTTKDEFAAAVSGNTPRVVVVSGKIISMSSGVKQEGGYAIDIGSNKTIVGIDKQAELYGGINIKNSSNVIVSNLNIHGVWPYTGPSDTVNIESSHHVWLNHLNVWNSKDGNIDTKTGADYITISWCKLWYEDVVCEWDTKDGTQSNRQYKKGDTAYAKDHGHRLACLIGSGAGDHDDTDMGKLHVTYHHNWFADNLDQRMPRVMYGRAHIYNNYYASSGNSYCTAVDCYGAILVEKNYFQNVSDPHRFHYDNDYPASIVARDNIYDNTKGEKQEGQKSQTAKVALYDTTVYDYFLNNAEDVPNIVQGFAGPRNGVKDTQGVPAELKKGTLIKGVEKTPEKADTSNPLPTLAPANSKNDKAITYDSASKTYTYHGQNTDNSNAYYTIKNPFAGKDFSEKPTYKNGYPVWTKGVTIAYWVKLPKGKDAAVMNFNLENDRQIQREDAVHYNKCSAYSPNDSTYSLGTMKKYVDTQGRIYTVLSGYGSNVRYNPNYPLSGYYYATDKGGAYYVYEQGSDPSVASNWTYLDYIGKGYYAEYAYLYDEEGGDGNSKVSEACISGSFSLYGSGTLGYRQDNWSGLQRNPNLDNYGQVVDLHQFNQFYYFGNGGLYTLKGSSLKTPTMADTSSQWHYVVTVIKNDWIQLYMDGKEITTDYLNYWGADLMKNINFAGQGFNLGYGSSKNYRTSNPSAGFSTDMLLLDFLSDEDTTLMIGGLGAGAERLSMHTIGTPDGTQVKDLEFYDIPVEASSISATGITLQAGYTEALRKNTEQKQQKYAIRYDKDLDPIVTQGPTPSPITSIAPQPSEKASTKPESSEKVSTKPESSEQVSAKPESSEEASTTPESSEKASTKPEESEKASTTPESSEKVSTKPESSEKASTKPEESEKASTTPESSEKVSTKPESSEKVSTKPESSEKASTKPESSEKVSTKPESSEKASTKPETSEKTSTKPESSEKASTKPESSEKTSTKPESSEKASTKPESSEKASTKPESSEKASTKPESSEKASTKPESSEKASTKPESSEKVSNTPKPSEKVSNAPKPSTPATGSPSPNPQKFEWGNVDQKGGVNLKDAQLALKMALHLVTNASEEQKKLGDVMNPGDGVTLKDAQAILRRALNLFIIFDVEK